MSSKRVTAYNTEFFRYLNQKVGYFKSTFQKPFPFSPHYGTSAKLRSCLQNFKEFEFNSIFFVIFFVVFNVFLYLLCLDSMAQTLRNTCCNYAKYLFV